MPTADEFAVLRSSGAGNLFRWEAYDPTSKVDLCASAVVTGSRLFFIDPIPLAKSALAELLAEATPAGIVVTNANHARAAEDYRRRFKIPLTLTQTASAETGLEADEIVPAEGGLILDGAFEAIPVSGGAAGEIALYRPEEGGFWIVGDAVINLPSFPLSLLPNKYCENPKELRRSVTRLLDRPFSTMLFAHGEPLLDAAHARLAALLAATDAR